MIDGATAVMRDSSKRLRSAMAPGLVLRALWRLDHE